METDECGVCLRIGFECCSAPLGSELAPYEKSSSTPRIECALKMRAHLQLSRIRSDGFSITMDSSKCLSFSSLTPAGGEKKKLLFVTHFGTFYFSLPSALIVPLARSVSIAQTAFCCQRGSERRSSGRMSHFFRSLGRLPRSENAESRKLCAKPKAINLFTLIFDCVALHATGLIDQNTRKCVSLSSSKSDTKHNVFRSKTHFFLLSRSPSSFAARSSSSPVDRIRCVRFSYLRVSAVDFLCPPSRSFAYLAARNRFK